MENHQGEINTGQSREYEVAVNNLHPEAQDFIRTRNNTGIPRTFDLAIAVRASLVADHVKTDLGGLTLPSNCNEAVAELNKLAQSDEIDAFPGLVTASPWQQADSRTHIHTLSILYSKNDDRYFFADPMPAAGYLYGTSGLLDRDLSPDNFVAYDFQLGATNRVKLLQPNEVEAIFIYFAAKTGQLNSQDEMTQALITAAGALKEVPSYQTRIFALIDSLNGLVGTDQSYLNQFAQPLSVRYSQLSQVSDVDKRAMIKQNHSLEMLKKREYLERAMLLADHSRSIYERNYWVALSEVLGLGYTGVAKKSAITIGQHIVGETVLPIKAYETFMLGNHIGYCSSNLYDNWQ